MDNRIIRKVAAALFTLALTLTAVWGTGGGLRQVYATQAGNQTVTVAFGNGIVEGTNVTYNVGGTDVVVTLSSDVPAVEMSNKTTTITLNNKVLTGMTVGDTFDASTMEMKLTAEDGFNCSVVANAGVLSYDADGLPASGAMTFSIAPKSNGGNDPGQGNNQGNNGSQSNNTQVDAITFSIGGQSYTISDMSNPTVRVDADSIANLEFAITRVTLNGTPYTLSGVGNGQYATAQDAEHRSVLQIIPIQGGENTGSQWSVGLQYHGNDDEEVNGRDTVNTTVPSFYIPQVTFTSNTQKGVQVTSSTQPDMYDPTVYPAQVDISQSSRENPARTAVYYDSSDFSISEVNGTAVSSIAVTDGGTAGAVTITGNTVTFNSGYYTSIPLTVTLADGTVGYMQVDRLGIELRETRSDGGILYHGSKAGSNMATVAGAGTYNIAAVFYYDAAKDYTDYDMVANLTYSNGTTETRVVGGFAQTVCNTPTLKGGEYLIWSGESVDAMPASVSVTAVKHGAASGSSFGGALFGAGKGVTKNFK